VTAVTCLFIIQEKEKENQKKKNIKSRKMLVSKHTITNREKLLREVMIKIGLKQEDNEEKIVVETLLDSEVIELVMSLEFVRKSKFKKKSWIDQ